MRRWRSYLTGLAMVMALWGTGSATAPVDDPPPSTSTTTTTTTTQLRPTWSDPEVAPEPLATDRLACPGGECPRVTPRAPVRQHRISVIDVETWRSLVGAYFRTEDVDLALRVIACESHGDPAAQNPRSSAAGLFQHLTRYWARRAAAAGFAGASVFDPEANVAAAAWLVYSDGGWSHWRASQACWSGSAG